MARAERKLVVSSPYFKLLLWINVALCAITLLTMIGLAAFGAEDLNRHQQMLFSTCEKIFTLTAGTLIGLLGGKAGSPV
jgi:hypothetical protein